MSKPTEGQLYEFYRQLLDERITGESLQVLLEEGPKLGFRKLLNVYLERARAAANTTGSYHPFWQAEMHALAAQASGDLYDLENARRILKHMESTRDDSGSNWCWRGKIYALIAQVSGDSRDLKFAREAVRRISIAFNNGERVELYALIAQASGYPKDLKLVIAEAEEVYDPCYRANIYSIIAKASGDSHYRELAYEAVERLTNEEIRAENYALVVVRTINNFNDFDLAIEAIKKVPSRYYWYNKINALMAVALAEAIKK